MSSPLRAAGPAPATPSATRVGWIGIGIMGAPMCRHLLQAGYRMSIHTRDKTKASQLLAAGATWAESPAAVTEQTDVVITMVGFPTDVRDVYLGATGVLSKVRPRMVLVDMTSTEPSLAQTLSRLAQARGAYAVDAPVSGGDVGARNATLSIMVGGAAEAVEAIRPLLECLGEKILHQGEAGTGQHAKLCNQIVIAGTMVGVCESLLYGYKAGLQLNRMLDSIRGGAAACWSLDHLAPRMLARNFDPGFFVEHFIKDLGIALEEARRLDLTLPGLTLAYQLYERVRALGHGRAGTHALMLALEDLSHLDVPNLPPAS
jgi:3-hydroxyisobutyrate dehydrogenase